MTRSGQFPHLYQSLPGNDDGDVASAPGANPVSLPDTFREWIERLVRVRSGERGFDGYGGIDWILGHLVWMPDAALVETEGRTGLWQMLAPTPAASCSTFGTNDTVSLRAWSAGRDTPDRQYAWNLWRPYRCCLDVEDGFFLGYIDWMSYP